MAVSIGTAHGVYSSAPVIDFERAEEIVRILPCPTVVHGASCTPDEDIRKLCRMGVAKINVGTDLNHAFNRGILNGFVKYGEKAAIREYMGEGRRQVIEAARKKIQIFRG